MGGYGRARFCLRCELNKLTTPVSGLISARRADDGDVMPHFAVLQ